MHRFFLAIILIGLFPLPTLAECSVRPLRAPAGTPLEKDITLASFSKELLGKWVVTDIIFAQIVDGSAPRFHILEGEIRGDAGCNAFQASLSITDDTVLFGEPDKSGNTCAANVAQMEASFMNALSLASRYTIDGSGNLALYGGSSVVIRAKRDPG